MGLPADPFAKWTKPPNAMRPHRMGPMGPCQWSRQIRSRRQRALRRRSINRHAPSAARLNRAGSGTIEMIPVVVKALVSQ